MHTSIVHELTMYDNALTGTLPSLIPSLVRRGGGVGVCSGLENASQERRMWDVKS